MNTILYWMIVDLYNCSPYSIMFMKFCTLQNFFFHKGIVDTWMNIYCRNQLIHVAITNIMLSTEFLCYGFVLNWMLLWRQYIHRFLSCIWKTVLYFNEEKLVLWVSRFHYNRTEVKWIRQERIKHSLALDVYHDFVTYFIILTLTRCEKIVGAIQLTTLNNVWC